MTIAIKRSARASVLTLVLLFMDHGVAQSSQAAPAAAAAVAIKDIELSYKRDPRQVDPYRGVGPWASGPSYAGATAQSTVETVARAIDSRGQPVTASLEWIPSDSEMVTVSPNRGDHVEITVHKVGESHLQIKAGGFSKELVVKAIAAGKFLVFQITPPVPAKADRAASSQISPALKSKQAQLSYALGMRLARTLQKQSIELDPDLVKRGIKDALADGQALMSEEQAHMTLIGVQTELGITEAAVERKVLADKNKKEGEVFLGHNKKQGGVVTLPSGLQYRILKAGAGTTPTLTDTVTCKYRGLLLDGAEFDNKLSSSLTFPVSRVIKGWQEALTLMPVGSRWRLFVPSDLAYGVRGMPRAKIPPNAVLVFDVELLAVNESNASRQTTGVAGTPTASDVVAALKKVEAR
jgi:FKBP-type peptidyl-prolyl cis-trans isomerase FklB